MEIEKALMRKRWLLKFVDGEERMRRVRDRTADRSIL